MQQDTSPATADASTGTIAITSSEKYFATSNPQPVFLIDFGGRVTPLNPLSLYNMTGTDRMDVVFDVTTGKVYIVAFVPDPGASADLIVSVGAGTAFYADGSTNKQGASFKLEYRPNSSIIKVIGIICNLLLGAAIAATIAATYYASVLNPYAAAGLLGYGVFGLIIWGQKFYALSNYLAVYNNPENFRQMGGMFDWTLANIPAPFDSMTTKATASGLSRTVGFAPGLIVQPNGQGGPGFLNGSVPLSLCPTNCPTTTTAAPTYVSLLN
jgi:hypothetical protein